MAWLEQTWTDLNRREQTWTDLNRLEQTWTDLNNLNRLDQTWTDLNNLKKQLKKTYKHIVFCFTNSLQYETIVVWFSKCSTTFTTICIPGSTVTQWLYIIFFKNRCITAKQFITTVTVATAVAAVAAVAVATAAIGKIKSFFFKTFAIGSSQCIKIWCTWYLWSKI